MKQTALPPGTMRRNVFSKPDLIREVMPSIDEQVRSVLNHETCLRLRRVLAGGSGDSHVAAVATEMAFEVIAGIPMEAQSGLRLSRYTIPWVPPTDARHTLAIGISYTGQTSRTLELIQLARQKGMSTLAISGDAESLVSKAADWAIDIGVSDPDVPGVRTFLTMLLAMYSIALRFAEVREVISQPVGQYWREELLRTADTTERTTERISDIVRQMAVHLKDRSSFVFVGSGPSFGTALFAAEKIMEATGRNAMVQDVEEWPHLDRWTVEQGLPTFMIVPPGLSYRRAVEISRWIKDTGRYLIALIDEAEDEIAPIADVVLRVYGQVPEPLTPIVYSSAIEMFASDLAQELNEPYMRDFVAPWTSDDEPVLRRSETLSSLEPFSASLHRLLPQVADNPSTPSDGVTHE